MKKDWWKDAVVYQIYPRSFKDSNNDGIGYLQGIISKLSYLKKLGINVIWLSPIYESPNIDYGYDVANYRKINSEFSTMADMDELIAKAKELNIKIVMDLVLNHTSDKNPWFQEAIKSKDNPYHDYYIWRDRIPNDMKDGAGESAWVYVPQVKQYYFHQFDKRQPDLNWDNPKLRQAIYDVMQFWIDKGVAGFRIDVVDLIGKDPDKKITVSGPNLHKYLREMNQKVLQDGEIMTVGEVWSAGIKEGRQYTYPGELDMIFQFQHILLEQQPGKGKWYPQKINASKLKKTILRWQTELGSQGWNALFWENHDLPRSVSVFTHKTKQKVIVAKMLAIMNCFLKGTPYIFEGQEIGMENYPFQDVSELRDDEEKRFYAQSKDKKEALWRISQGGRDNARTPMQWDATKNAGFNEGEKTWINVNPNYLKVNVESERQDSSSIFNLYQSLLAFRKAKSLSEASFEEIPALSPQVLGFIRKNNEYELKIYLNLDRKCAHVKDKSLLCEDILFNNYKNVQIKTSGLDLRPFEAVVLKEK